MLTWVFVGLAVAVTVGAVLVVRRRTEELIVRAEAAYPGPLES